jgi:hypothetical protein
MIMRSERRARNRAASVLLALGLSLALACAALPPATASAGDEPADTLKTAGQAAEKSGKSETTKTKKAETKSAAKTKESKKSKKAANAKGGAVSEGTKAAPGTMPVKPAVEPQHVQVQHILIGFAGSIPGKGITRTMEEAKKLAYEVLERARNGEDFDALVKQYTDDSPPGIYGMSGKGVAPGQGEYPRDQMVPAFGNVGFAISPGNIGIADYDPLTSPYGFHIIKRLK